MILVNIIGLLMTEETMISPQEYGEGMSMEEYARVMPGEKYWREHIAKEIETEFMAEGADMASNHELMNKREMAIWKLCAAIARGQK